MPKASCGAYELLVPLKCDTDTTPLFMIEEVES